MKNEWIPASVKPAEDEGEVLLYNEKWIDEDFNPKGTRVGFYTNACGWTSAYWCDAHDVYNTGGSDEEECHTPTHWMKLPIFKDSIDTEPEG